MSIQIYAVVLVSNNQFMLYFCNYITCYVPPYTLNMNSGSFNPS